MQVLVGKVTPAATLAATLLGVKHRPDGSVEPFRDLLLHNGMLKTRQTCRACGSAALTPVISLGEQYLASNFAISSEFPPVERTIPLDVVRCDAQRDEAACGLVQLRHTVPSALMYSSYGYRSGVNQTMTRHLGE